MYTVGIILYGIAVYIASFFNRKAKLLFAGQRQSFRILKEKIDPEADYIWFHAASLGEFEQGRVLMESIRRQYPHYKILLTFFSPSGYEVMKNYQGADVICYLPLDTFYNSTKFLKLVNPKMVFFIKYEFWANYLYDLKHKHIPTYSIASIFRSDQVFFKSYGLMYMKILGCFTHFFVQNEESRILLAQKGFNNVSVVGDTRFDRVLQIRDAARDIPMASAFARQTGDDGYMMVAGSSWPQDEDIIIDYFNRHPEQRLILAPHVVSEAHLHEIEEKLRRPSVRLSQATEETAGAASCLIVDGYGMLSSIYRYARRAYIGGGFGAGIHNVPEAAVYGIPTIIGPNNKKFREVQQLIAENATFEIHSLEDYEAIMARLDDDAFCRQAGERAKAFIEREAGTVDRIMSEIDF